MKKDESHRLKKAEALRDSAKPVKLFSLGLPVDLEIPDEDCVVEEIEGENVRNVIRKITHVSSYQAER